tara:strand:- start:11 stop:193 length:183 start_codon:yes stop_codon:yes gene_type:complete
MEIPILKLNIIVEKDYLLQYFYNNLSFFDSAVFQKDECKNGVILSMKQLVIYNNKNGFDF